MQGDTYFFPAIFKWKDLDDPRLGLKVIGPILPSRDYSSDPILWHRSQAALVFGRENYNLAASIGLGGKPKYVTVWVRNLAAAGPKCRAFILKYRDIKHIG
jgi:hypothetical protein